MIPLISPTRHRSLFSSFRFLASKTISWRKQSMAERTQDVQCNVFLKSPFNMLISNSLTCVLCSVLQCQKKKNEMKITLNALRAKTEAVNLYKYTARYISILIKSNIQCSTCRQQNLPTQINTDTHIYSFIYSNSATFG